MVCDMARTFRYSCKGCGREHEGMPTFGAKAPLHYFVVPEEERPRRCSLGTDDCVIDGKWFFVRGCLEIHVHGADEPFIWGVWVSLSEEDFKTFIQIFGRRKRSSYGPFSGWLSAELPLYPSTENLKTWVHLRDKGIRPAIELERTDHPLAVEQRDGITVDRVAEIYAHFERQGNAS